MARCILSMSELKGRTTEELAFLMWEQQGRPEHRSVENWIEAEYLAHPLSVSQQPTMNQNEVEMRMRGLGPLTQREPFASVSTPSPITKQTDQSGQRALSISILAGSALLMAAGALIFIFRKNV